MSFIIHQRCTNSSCEWVADGSSASIKEEDYCPVCGAPIDIDINFGGLKVKYKGAKDRFSLGYPGEPLMIEIDNMDSSDVVRFFQRHCKDEVYDLEKHSEYIERLKIIRTTIIRHVLPRNSFALPSWNIALPGNLFNF